MKKEFQDRIDNYLLHRMTEEQRKAFEQELLTDEELRDQLEFGRFEVSCLQEYHRHIHQTV